MSRSVRIEEVIITDLTTRGNGVTTPIRQITQVFTLGGKLIAEHDPLPQTSDEAGTVKEYGHNGIHGWVYDTKPNSKTDNEPEADDESVITRAIKVGANEATIRFVFPDKGVPEPTYTFDDLNSLTDYFAKHINALDEDPRRLLSDWLKEPKKG